MDHKIIEYRIIYVCLVKLPALKAFLCKAFVLAIKEIQSINLSESLWLV